MWSLIAVQLMTASLVSQTAGTPFDATALKLDELKAQQAKAKDVAVFGGIAMATGLVLTGVGLPLMLSDLNINIFGYGGGSRSSTAGNVGAMFFFFGLPAIPLGMATLTFGLVRGASTATAIESLEKDRGAIIDGGTVSWSIPL